MAMAKPNGEYKIEKGVPMPQKNNWAVKYPFAEMEVGDSFLGPRAVQVAAWKYAQVIGRKIKFVTRREGDGYRVWRIE